jgi:hypothetical protein
LQVSYLAKSELVTAVAATIRRLYNLRRVLLADRRGSEEFMDETPYIPTRPLPALVVANRQMTPAFTRSLRALSTETPLRSDIAMTSS